MNYVMSYRYIKGFTLSPTGDITRYRGLPGYPQVLYPEVQICLKQKGDMISARYVSFNPFALQLLNTGNPEKITIPLPVPYPIVSRRLPQLYDTYNRALEVLRQ